MWYTLFLGIFVQSVTTSNELRATPKLKTLYGKSVQLDLTNSNFELFMNTSDDIGLNIFIQDLKSREIETIIYMIPDGREQLCLEEEELCQFQKKILARFRQENFGVWLMIFGSLFYFNYNDPKTRPSNPDWLNWQVQFLDKDNGSGIGTMSMHRQVWLIFQTTRIPRILASGYFDGVHLTETFFPPGPVNKGTGVSSHPYADVSPFVIQTKFCKEYLMKSNVDCQSYTFQKILSSRSDLYLKWVRFRTDTVTNFVKNIKIAVGSNYAFGAWVIEKTCLRPSDCAPEYTQDRVGSLKEWYGLSGSQISAIVQPDIIVIQTDWPDWTNQDLTENYPVYYSTTFNDIRSNRPTQAIGLQADIASCHCQYLWKTSSTCNKGFNSTWYDALNQNSNSLGYKTIMAYEYWFSVKCGIWLNPAYSAKFNTITINRVLDLYVGAADPNPIRRNIFIGTVPFVGEVWNDWKKIIFENDAYWVKAYSQ